MLGFFWIIRWSLRKVGNAAVRIHTMKSSLMKPLFSGSEGSSSCTGFLQFTGLFVPEKEQDKTRLVTATFMSLMDPGAEFSQITLESYSKVVVSTRVPELHMLVCPPCNALFHQRNCISGAIGINMIQLQSVWNTETFKSILLHWVSAANELMSWVLSWTELLVGVRLDWNPSAAKIFSFAEEKNAKLFTVSRLPLKRLLAMAPHGAMGSPSLVRYGSHSLLGLCEKQPKLNRCRRHLLKSWRVAILTFPTLYHQRRPVAVQLAVIPGLHVTPVVLVEVG